MAASGGDADQPVITVDATAPQRALSPEMYGIFFEEISHAGDGGLYTELVQNRDMEASTIPLGGRVDPNRPNPLVEPPGVTEPAQRSEVTPIGLVKNCPDRAQECQT